MKLTHEQLKAAARKLCKLRAVDPDCNVGGWETYEDLAAKEIEVFLEIQECVAIATELQNES